MHLCLHIHKCTCLVHVWLLTYIHVSHKGHVWYRLLDWLQIDSLWLNIKIQPPRLLQDTKASKWLIISRFKRNTVKQSLTTEMDSKLRTLGLASNDGEADRASLRDTIYAAATEVIGSITHKQQDLFDENDACIQVLLEEKHHLQTVLFNDPASSSKKAAFRDISRNVQRELSHIQDT